MKNFSKIEFQKSDSGLSSLYASNNIKLDTQLMNNNSDNTESLSISNLSNSKINNNKFTNISQPILVKNPRTILRLIY